MPLDYDTWQRHEEDGERAAERRYQLHLHADTGCTEEEIDIPVLRPVLVTPTRLTAPEFREKEVA